jgi:ABC-type transporter Mla MlaB component
LLAYEIVSHHRGEVRIALRGQLVTEEWTARLLTFLERHYLDEGLAHIHLDLAGLDGLDLEGLGALFALMREAQVRGKRLTAGNASGQVREKLATTGVLRYLQEGRLL